MLSRPTPTSMEQKVNELYRLVPRMQLDISNLNKDVKRIHSRQDDLEAALDATFHKIDVSVTDLQRKYETLSQEQRNRNACKCLAFSSLLLILMIILQW